MANINQETALPKRSWNASIFLATWRSMGTSRGVVLGNGDEE
jgi:hypothetical protein